MTVIEEIADERRRQIETGTEERGESPKPRQWLHDIEHEAAALAVWQERAKIPGRLSAKEKADIQRWAKEFRCLLRQVSMRPHPQPHPGALT